MFESFTIIILVVFALALFVVPFIVNAVYQRKASRYTDKIIEGNIIEFNKQIKANAVTVLIRRSIWGLLFLSGIILNFRAVLEQGFHWLTVVYLVAGIACFAFGIWGYRSELKRLKTLE